MKYMSGWNMNCFSSKNELTFTKEQASLGWKSFFPEISSSRCQRFDKCWLTESFELTSNGACYPTPDE